MPITTGFNHIATLTSDMDRTIQFYQTAFDAKVVFEVARSDDHPWMKIVDIGGGGGLNVFEVPAEEIIGERRRSGHRGAVDHFASGRLARHARGRRSASNCCRSPRGG